MIPPEFEYLTVEFEPEGNPRIPFEAGQVLEKAGNLAGAATMYNRAFGLAPDDTEIGVTFTDLLDRLVVQEHGLTWRYIPGGVFLMGNNFSEPDERPWHPVWLKPYWIMDTCVTWDDLTRLMGLVTERSERYSNLPRDPAYEFLRETPHLMFWMEQMVMGFSTGSAETMREMQDEWRGRTRETQVFNLKPNCSTPYPLAALLGHHLTHHPDWNEPSSGKRRTRAPARGQYQLPTEAQWEKAARGGLIGAPFPWGWEPATPERIDCDRFYDFGIKPMRSLPANAYGLHGMCGGVWEWTSDFYDREYYRQSPHEDPTGPAKGEERVLRGGSWADCPDVCTVSFRSSMPGDKTRFRRHGLPTPTVGFRMVRTVGMS